jgi:hypothetical protein
LLKYSSAMATSPWQLRGFSSLSTTETAPDGTSTAVKVEEDNTDSNPAVYYNADTGDGSQQAFSVWLKADSNISLYLSTTGDALGSLVSVTTEWQRFEVTQTINGASGPHIGGFFTITQGSGVTFYMWGAQLETGPIATSYMPTTGSPFTRGKDEASMTNVSGLIGQKEGTLYVEVDWRLATGTYQFLLEASDGTANNRILIYDTNSSGLSMFAGANGAPLTNQGVLSTSYSGIQKFAFAYADADFELYRNGSSATSYTTGSLASLATLTDIDIGQDYNANFQANMWIRAVQIIPRRLSDEQLIELTS